VERCRLGVNEETPFACPENCLFFEPRAIADAGWQRTDPSTDPDHPSNDPDDPT